MGSLRTQDTTIGTLVRRLVAVALVMTLGLAGCARDQYTTTYADTITARQQGAVDRGWIPDWLPEDATGLREVHRPRTGDAVIRATLPGGLLPDSCFTVETVSAPPLRPRWIGDLRGTPVRCGTWDGRLDRAVIVAWTSRQQGNP
jgi:hypothetical protein